MRNISATVGPLVSGVATLVSASQTVGAAQGVAFNGSGATFVAANIAASQTVGAGGAVTLVSGIGPSATQLVGGGLPTTTVGLATFSSQIVISGSGNSSGTLFTIVGVNDAHKLVTDVIPGPNNGVSATVNRFQSLVRIVANGASSGAITIGTATPVTLDTTRQIAIASNGNDSGITFTVTGLDLVGNTITEVIQGTNAGTAVSALDFYVVGRIYTSGATASTVTVGTNGVARTSWICMDTWAGAQSTVTADVTGTVNYTIQATNDDPNSPTNPITAPNMTWQSVGVVGSTTPSLTNLPAIPAYVRGLLNSGSGSVTIGVIQALNAPL